MEKRFRYLASQLWRVAIVASLLPAAVGFAIQSELALAAADVDAEYRDPNEPGDGMQVVILNDRVLDPGKAFSYLMGPSDRSGRYGPLCDSLTDERCSGEKTVSYKAVLQPCS